MTDIPPEAVTEAMRAAWEADYAWWKSPDRERGGSWGSVPEAQLRRLLEAAAPHLAAAAPETCPLCGCDLECRGCYCHEDPDDKSYKAGAAAERERIIRLASQLRATIPADHPAGARASFADYLRVTRSTP